MVTIPGLATREPAHEYLPAGYADPVNPLTFVDEADRPYYPHNEPELDKRLTRELIRDSRTMSRTVWHRGRAYTAEVTAETDFEAAMHCRKATIAKERRQNAESRAQQEANAAHWWTCGACGVVKAPGIDSTGVLARALPGGLGEPKLCGPCFVVAHAAVVDGFRAERIDGKTRAELVAGVLADLPSRR